MVAFVWDTEKKSRFTYWHLTSMHDVHLSIILILYCDSDSVLAPSRDFIIYQSFNASKSVSAIMCQKPDTCTCAHKTLYAQNGRYFLYTYWNQIQEAILWGSNENPVELVYKLEVCEQLHESPQYSLWIDNMQFELWKHISHCFLFIKIIMWYCFLSRNYATCIVRTLHFI